MATSTPMSVPASLPNFPSYPQLRFMGSKYRLLPWIESVLEPIEFTTALDALSGSGCVSYLLKTMGKRVHSNDFLAFTRDLAAAVAVNSHERLDGEDVAVLLEDSPDANHRSFIETTFRNIFFTDEENRFLDRVSSRLPRLSAAKAALTRAALYRSCLKKQPRGVFTVAGGRYDDGRRDLRLSLQEHFVESVAVFNELVFDNGHEHVATRSDALALDVPPPNLVYLDPPYVPRSDDNCYIKRYHFLEGLATYWQGVEFHSTRSPLSSPSTAERSLKPLRRGEDATGSSSASSVSPLASPMSGSRPNSART